MPDTRKVLCARFGVSRTPLREVLKMLAVKGLVNLLPNRSASVVCITAFGSFATIGPIVFQDELPKR